MRFDLDRYYTPDSVAVDAISRAGLADAPAAFVDPTCGNGQLLRAALKVHGSGQCIGLDRDRDTVRALRRAYPSWIVSAGDLLNPQSFSASRVARSTDRDSLLLLNTPFSQLGHRTVSASFQGKPYFTSVAMSYLLRSLDVFSPTHGAVAIVPESLLYSDTDLLARAALSSSFCMRVLRELKSSTFLGARARCAIVRFVPRRRRLAGHAARMAPAPTVRLGMRVTLVRGSLPVHALTCSRSGVPFVHTTDVSALVSRSIDADCLRRTGVTKKGLCAGWVVFLPRVGIPSMSYLRPYRALSTIQLSDCLFAIECSDGDGARLVSSVLRDNFDSLRAAYRGTGARYITLARLRDFLSELGFRVSL